MSDNQIIELCKSVARLEEQVKSIAADVDEIRSNHLPHLADEIESLKKFKWQLMAVVTFAVGVIELVFKYVIK